MRSGLNQVPYLKGQAYTRHARVRTITYLRIEALAYYKAILCTALLIFKVIKFSFFLICSVWLVLRYLANH